MARPRDDHRVVDNPERSRYELHIGDVVASTADYHRRDDVVVVPYVRTEPELRGRGMSDRLMRGLLEDLRVRGLRIEPVCWVAVAYVENHPAEAADLLAS
jgi:predicted GNAT family acetyltransferase